MKVITTYLLAGLLLNAGLATADVVIAEEADTVVGKMSGGWVGFLLGGVVGGPIGAFALGGAGAWSGGEVQQAAGLEGAAYRIKRDDGSELVVRSPNKNWNQGDHVQVSGHRLVEEERLSSSEDIGKIAGLVDKNDME